MASNNHSLAVRTSWPVLAMLGAGLLAALAAAATNETALLLLVLALILMLPFLPVVQELFRANDADRLPIPHVRDVESAQLNAQLLGALRARAAGNSQRPRASGMLGSILDRHWDVGARVTHQSEAGVDRGLYATEKITIETGSSLGIAVAEEALSIMPGASLSEWGYGRRVEVCGGRLDGTVVGREILVSGDCTFRRLHGAAIRFGFAATSAASTLAAARDENAGPQSLPAPRNERQTIRGDHRIADGEVVRADLVGTGTIVLGQAARIEGSIKARRIVLERDAVVTGCAFASIELTTEPGSRIHGVAAVDGELVMNGGTIGLPGRPVSVSAQDISVYGAATIHGEVRVRRYGEFRHA